MAWEVFDEQGRLMVNVSGSTPGGGGIMQLTKKGIVAHAGGLQPLATFLGAIYNFVDTVATTGDSVMVWPAVANSIQVVINRGAQDMEVYPYAGDAFWDSVNNVYLAANTPILVSAGSSLSIICNATGFWDITQ